MKIAIVGTRGIPARYGGFETLADQLSKRLVERGHTVTVYCRRPFTKPEDLFDHRVRRIILPTLASKHFDTLFHTFMSVLHVIFTDAEVVLICNVANSPFAVDSPSGGKADRSKRRRFGPKAAQMERSGAVVSPLLRDPFCSYTGQNRDRRAGNTGLLLAALSQAVRYDRLWR